MDSPTARDVTPAISPTATAVATAISPRREPWVEMANTNRSPLGAAANWARRFHRAGITAAPTGAWMVFLGWAAPI